MRKQENLRGKTGMVEGIPLAAIRRVPTEILGETPPRRSIIGNAAGCVIWITTAGLIMVGAAAVAPNLPGWTRAILAEAGKHGITINNDGFARSLSELSTTLGRPNPISDRLAPYIGEPFNPSK
ncbi:hypothetical protein HY345_00480 [Candidatus Microgenomates bacterium]|nr:hypothetical protein [Candidatus Microgenomates bacterium]